MTELAENPQDSFDPCLARRCSARTIVDAAADGTLTADRITDLIAEATRRMLHKTILVFNDWQPLYATQKIPTRPRGPVRLGDDPGGPQPRLHADCPRKSKSRQGLGVACNPERSPRGWLFDQPPASGRKRIAGPSLSLVRRVVRDTAVVGVLSQHIINEARSLGFPAAPALSYGLAQPVICLSISYRRHVGHCADELEVRSTPIKVLFASRGYLQSRRRSNVSHCGVIVLA